jgi:hypothetical protein
MRFLRGFGERRRSWLIFRRQSSLFFAVHSLGCRGIGTAGVPVPCTTRHYFIGTLQQRAGVLYFVARFDATERESCLLFEPLIELLEAAPGRSIEPLRAGNLAELLLQHLGER